MLCSSINRVEEGMHVILLWTVRESGKVAFNGQGRTSVTVVDKKNRRTTFVIFSVVFLIIEI